MINTSEIRAAKQFGPGYFIKEQMSLRNWTQEELAEIMGITLKHLNKILQEKQPLTLDIAKILGEIFGTSVQYWINLDTNYRLWFSQEKTVKEKEVEIKRLIYERMPVKDMLVKGWIKPFDNTDQLKEQVLNFWGWKKLDFTYIDTHYLPYFTRKSEIYNQFNASYAITWYQMAKNVSEKYKVTTYNRKKLEKLFNEIHIYSTNPKGINEFLRELNNTGVIFFVLSHLQKTYLDGATFFTGNNPVIVYTARYKRIDNFWFTVAHEIAHILKHLDGKTPFILDNLKDGERNDIENEANDMAAEKLKHKEILEYLNPFINYLTASKVEECAATYEVHPSIIIGKLARDDKISYKNLSLYNDDVLGLIDKEFIYNN